MKLKDKGDITKDGREVESTNIGSLDDLNTPFIMGQRESTAAKRVPVSWQGELSRGRRTFQAYKKTVETMGDRSVVIRTADSGR